MFTLDQLFTQIFPWLEGISWDLGTVLTGIVFLWFLVMAFDWLKEMFLGRMESSRYHKAAGFYYNEAKRVRDMRDMLNKDTIDYEEADLLYKSYLRKSASLRVKGRGLEG